MLNLELTSTVTMVAQTLLTLMAVVGPVTGYKFLAIGDWGASYENNDCSGTISAQQKQDAVAMVSDVASTPVPTLTQPVFSNSTRLISRVRILYGCRGPLSTSSALSTLDVLLE